MRLRDAVQEVELFFARPKGSMGMCSEEAVKTILTAAKQVLPPHGFAFTGEVRAPTHGEYYLSTGKVYYFSGPVMDNYIYPIVKKEKENE